MRLLNLRVPESLAELIEKAWPVSDSENRSAWCREALEAGARRELRALQMRSSQESSGVRHTAGVGPNGLLQPSGCQHPPTARKRDPRAESCTLCGAVTRLL